MPRIAGRKRGRRRALIVVVALAVVAGGIVFAVSQGGGTNAASNSTSPSVSLKLPDPATLPGILRTAPPWPDNIAQANDRLARLSAISPLPQLGATLHHHANLLIYVDGQQARSFAESTAIQDIQGIEVYRGSAEVPGEYSGSFAGCGVVAIWTRAAP